MDKKKFMDKAKAKVVSIYEANKDSCTLTEIYYKAVMATGLSYSTCQRVIKAHREAI